MPKRLALLLLRGAPATGLPSPAQPRAARYWPRLALSLLVALALPLLGVGVGALQARWLLQQRADAVADNAIIKLDRMITNGEMAGKAVELYAGRPCDIGTERVLQRQVATVPYVRSVNLSLRGQLYCTSLLGAVTETIDAAAYTDGRLRLRPGNITTPDVPVLIVRRPVGDAAILSVVDGRYLQTALQLTAQGSELYFRVGASHMDSQGRVGDGPLPPLPHATATRTSAHFPYSVVAGSPDGAVWTYMLEYNLALLVLTAGVGLFGGLLCYRLLGRPSSPRAVLQRALDAGQFEPFVQPIVNADDGVWAGVEVLARWHLPGEGLIRPDLFIPMAEQTGQILPMTRELMRQVAAALAPHVAELPPRFHIGFNISAAHCREPRLLDDCRDFLAAFPPDSVELWLELTERELIEPTDDTDLLFQQLDAIGVKVAIDDFGIGHASLNYLQRFAVDALKIDQSFVKRIGADTLSAHLIDTLAALATKLDIDLVAEGVETAAQRDYLQALNVRYLQGYYFGRPMPVGEFIHAHRHQRAAAETPAQPATSQ